MVVFSITVNNNEGREKVARIEDAMTLTLTETLTRPLIPAIEQNRSDIVNDNHTHHILSPYSKKRSFELLIMANIALDISPISCIILHFKQTAKGHFLLHFKWPLNRCGLINSLNG